MRKLISRFFPPFEVRETLSIARQFFESLSPMSRSVLEPEIVRAIKEDADKTVYSIRIDHIKPDHLVLMLLTNSIGKHLGSGQHHTYRGRLSATGQDMRSVWSAAQSRMVDSGYISVAEREEDDRWLAEQISTAG